MTAPTVMLPAVRMSARRRRGESVSQHALVGESLQVGAGLTKSTPDAFEVADPEVPSDKAVQVDAAGDDVASSLHVPESVAVGQGELSSTSASINVRSRPAPRRYGVKVPTWTQNGTGRRSEHQHTPAPWTQASRRGRLSTTRATETSMHWRSEQGRGLAPQATSAIARPQHAGSPRAAAPAGGRRATAFGSVACGCVTTRFGVGRSQPQSDGRARRALPAFIREHNRLVADDTRYVGSIVPIQDGVMAALRIE